MQSEDVEGNRVNKCGNHLCCVNSARAKPKYIHSHCVVWKESHDVGAHTEHLNGSSDQFCP